MPIKFACSNAGCGKSIKVPDGSEGKKVRCPSCGMRQRIPDGGSGGGMDWLDELGAAEAGSPAAAPAYGQASAGDVPYRCTGCGKRLMYPDALCSRCGGTAEQPASAPAATATAAPPAAFGGPFGRPPADGSLSGQCLGAIGYGFSNFGAVMTLVLVSVGVSFLFNLITIIPFLGAVIALVGGPFVALGLLGYVGRFLLDCILGSLEGSKEAPNVENFQLLPMASTGLRILGLIVVYVLPIVTIPLLPLGLLALAVTGDGRAYNLTWALKAASRNAGGLAKAWAFLLLWGVIGIGIVSGALFGVALAAVAAGAAAGGEGISALLAMAGVWLVGGLFVQGVGITMQVAACHCIGALGRFHRDIVDTLPPQSSAGLSLAFVGGGAAASSLVVFLAVSAAMGMVEDRRLNRRAARRGPDTTNTALREPARGGAPHHANNAPPPRRQTAAGADPLLPAEPAAPSAAHRRHGYRKLHPSDSSVAVARKKLRNLWACIQVHQQNHAGALPQDISLLTRECLVTPEDTLAPDGRPYTLRHILPEHALPGDYVLYSLHEVEGKLLAMRHDGTIAEVAGGKAGLEQALRRQDARLRRAVADVSQYRRAAVREEKSLVHQAEANLRNLLHDIMLFASKNQGQLPASIAELRAAAGCVVDEADLHPPADPARTYVLLKEDTPGADPTTILAYDPHVYPAARKMDRLYAIVVDGRTGILSIRQFESQEQFQKQLAEQGLREPPQLVRLSEEAVKAPRPPKQVEIKQTAPLHDQAQARLKNIAAALKQYKLKHDGKLPKTLEELRSSGALKNEADLTPPGGVEKHYVLVPEPKAGFDWHNVLLYDPHIYTFTDRPFVYYLDGALELRFYTSESELRRKLERQGSPMEVALAEGGAAEAPAPTSNVDWQVEGWSKAELARGNPLAGECDAYREFATGPRSKGLAAVHFGPEAKDMADRVFRGYRVKVTRLFDAARNQAGDMTTPKEMQQTIAGAQYYRVMAFKDSNCLTVLMTVQDGRCVSYWYVGRTSGWARFVVGLGKAKVKQEDQEG